MQPYNREYATPIYEGQSGVGCGGKHTTISLTPHWSGSYVLWHSKVNNMRTYNFAHKSKFCGQNCTFAWANRAFMVKIFYSWTKLLHVLCIGKLSLHSQMCFHGQSLYLHLQTHYSWSNSTFVFAHISMAMTKRHVLVLASFFMCTLCMLAQAHALCLKRLDPLLAALSPHQGIPTFLFSCSRFPFHHIERLSCAILYSTDTWWCSSNTCSCSLIVATNKDLDAILETGKWIAIIKSSGWCSTANIMSTCSKVWYCHTTEVTWYFLKKLLGYRMSYITEGTLTKPGLDWATWCNELDL